MSSERDGSAEGSRASHDTTYHVRRAIAGESESLTWIVTHFHPLLLTQARYHLAKRVAPALTAEDLVQEAWAIALPRLGDLVEREDRLTPVLLKFLGSTVLNCYQGHLHRAFRERRDPAAGALDSRIEADDRIPRPEAIPGLGTLLRAERVATLAEVLGELPDELRELIVLRGVERIPYTVLAARQGASEGALRVRYHRAIERLRRTLPDEILDEMS